MTIFRAIGLISLSLCFQNHLYANNLEFRTVDINTKFAYDGEGNAVDLSFCPNKVPVRIYSNQNGYEWGSTLGSCLAMIDGKVFNVGYSFHIKFSPEGNDTNPKGKSFDTYFSLAPYDPGLIRENPITDSNSVVIPEDYRGSVFLRSYLSMGNEEYSDYYVFWMIAEFSDPK